MTDYSLYYQLPTGIICMWSGTIATIPTGWALCNGSNGTPDLRDKFICGARSDQGGQAKTYVTNNYEKQGGSITHTHFINAIETSVGTGDALDVDYGSAQLVDFSPHTHSVSGFTNAPWSDIAGDEIDHLPPFYALAFIMKL